MAATNQIDLSKTNEITHARKELGGKESANASFYRLDIAVIGESRTSYDMSPAEARILRDSLTLFIRRANAQKVE